MNAKPTIPDSAQAAVLLVDDTPASLRLVAHHLEASGFRVMVAEDGAKAIECARSARPDLILLDIMMPGIDGISVCRRLKSDPTTAGIPVVFQTSLNEPETIVAGFAAGGVDFLSKPVQLDELLARVRSHIALRRQHHDLEARLRQAQKMEAFGQLAGGVAHDFNNIMSVVLGQAELAMEEGSMPASIRTALLEIREASLRARNLTRQLLVFSRRQEMQFELVDLNAVVTDVAGLLGRLIGENIALELQLAPTATPVVGDAGMLGQVVVNIAVNARDAMPGGGRLVITTGRRQVTARPENAPAGSGPGEYIVLGITDTGTGMTAEVLNRIFEPFFTTKEIGKGTGLGLATSLSIVQQHGGWIDVRSEPGHGTTLDVFLPCPAGSGARLTRPVAGRPAALTNQGTILLVEDETSVRRVATRSLERLGFRVIEAGDGEEAIEAWHEHRASIDLVLTDIVMPGKISGRALARRLREEAPDVRIALMTGYDPDVLAQKLAEQDRDLPHIQKPFTVDALAEFIRRVLGR